MSFIDNLVNTLIYNTQDEKSIQIYPIWVKRKVIACNTLVHRPW